jgi:multidrug resistance efflux pump
MTTPSESAPSTPQPGNDPTRFDWLRQSLGLVLSIGIALAALAVLYFEPYRGGDDEPRSRTNTPDRSVQITDAGLLHIKPDSTLKDKLTFNTVRRVQVKTPILVVTGSIAARLGPGPDNAAARWDFITSDLANAYVDWLKARDEVVFTEKQFESIKELSEAPKVVDRLTMLVKIGTDSEKDLAAAKAELAQTLIQGQKDVHEANTAKKNAVRNRATLERQLYQAGVDPELLVNAKDNLAIVVAEVPEAKLSLVKKGQKCQAVFYAFADEPVDGHVGSVSPTVSKERRTLRVFFELPDKKDHFKPGMFADVRLGTEPRDVLLIPAAAVLHVGKFDYVFAGVKDRPNDWEAVKVTLGEVHKNRVEVLTGLAKDRPVIGQGAILLKPYLIAALQKLSAEEDRP